MADKRSTPGQFLEIGHQMFDASEDQKPKIDRALAQAIIDGRIRVVSDRLQSSEITIASMLGPLHDSCETLRIWTQNLYRELGLNITVELPPELTSQQIELLREAGFRLFYIPGGRIWDIIIDDDACSFYHASLDEKMNEGTRISSYSGSIYLNGDLPKWVAVEILPKLRRDEVENLKLDHFAKSLGLQSRFGHRWEDLKGGVLTKAAQALNFPNDAVRLPTVGEWNFLCWLWRQLKAKGDSTLPLLMGTNTLEWCWTCVNDEDHQCTSFDNPGHFAMARKYKNMGQPVAEGFGANRQTLEIGFRLLVDLSPEHLKKKRRW